jgi:hypothetical protein
MEITINDTKLGFYPMILDLSKKWVNIKFGCFSFQRADPNNRKIHFFDIFNLFIMNKKPILKVLAVIE